MEKNSSTNKGRRKTQERSKGDVIGGLVVIGGALAVAGLIATFAIIKRKAKEAKKKSPATTPTVASQESITDCSNHEEDEGSEGSHGLRYLLQDSSPTAHLTCSSGSSTNSVASMEEERASIEIGGGRMIIESINYGFSGREVNVESGDDFVAIQDKNHVDREPIREEKNIGGKTEEESSLTVDSGSPLVVRTIDVEESKKDDETNLDSNLPIMLKTTIEEDKKEEETSLNLDFNSPIITKITVEGEKKEDETFLNFDFGSPIMAKTTIEGGKKVDEVSQNFKGGKKEDKTSLNFDSESLIIVKTTIGGDKKDDQASITVDSISPLNSSVDNEDEDADDELTPEKGDESPESSVESNTEAIWPAELMDEATPKSETDNQAEMMSEKVKPVVIEEAEELTQSFNSNSKKTFFNDNGYENGSKAINDTLVMHQARANTSKSRIWILSMLMVVLLLSLSLTPVKLILESFRSSLNFEQRF